MSQPEQWRFQWPDGTWIRWNPHTQTWEKEPPGAEGDTDMRESELDLPVAETPPAQDPDDPETPVAETPPAQEPDDPESPVAETPPAQERAEPEFVPRRSRRPLVGDVLPPDLEPEQPAGSLWPTVLTGIIVGLAVGLFLWNMIR